MTHRVRMEPMDTDSRGGSKVSPPTLQENGLQLYPVSVNDSGEGLPYSPEDWPNPGDKWGWKVGRRIANSGYFLDRYIYLPRSLHRPGNPRGFASRLSVEQYVRAKFPDKNVADFFASFSWKIPSHSFKRDMFRSPGETAEDPGSHVHIDGVSCKAGNRSCSSLRAEGEPVSEVMFCDVCCSEPGFCRDCCCILCCRTINKASLGYSYITCEAKIGGYACGHSCHIDCALRAYMAGTVGGSISLDAEYYCRRCDSRTDLVSHVKKLLENCETNVSRDNIEKILRVGVCVLRGSNKESANRLLHRVELAMLKLNNGTDIEDIWTKEEGSAGTAVGPSPDANGASPTKEESQEMGLPQTLSSKFDHRIESLRLEDEIDQVLNELRKSQEIEYCLAEETLSTQKNCILNLYQQLDKDKSELSKHASSKDQDLLLDAVMTRIFQIKREFLRLRDMELVAKGFGRVPKDVLKEHFDVDICP